MIDFKQLASNNDLKEIVKLAFGLDMKISGSWGYEKSDFTDISKIEKDVKSTQNTLATMRANLEMNMLLNEEERYSSINIHEISREINDVLEKVKYEISAMKESDYKVFIQEYKDNSNNSSFDLEKHFSDRKNATIKRKVSHWFKIK